MPNLDDPELAGAATKIQSRYRGGKARREVEDKKSGGIGSEEAPPEGAGAAGDVENPADAEESLPNLDDPELAGAATKIQSRYRGGKARKEVEEKKAGTETAGTETAGAPPGGAVVAVEDEEMPNLDDPELAGAATRIQSRYRGGKARKEVEEKKTAGASGTAETEIILQAEGTAEPTQDQQAAAADEEMPNLEDPDLAGAATKIQSRYRGGKARREVGDKKATKDASNAAVVGEADAGGAAQAGAKEGEA